eukprot:2819035-Pyramimonas_sp.AAC.1
MAFCTDMGTELGVAEFKIDSHVSLLPDWFLPRGMELDADADMGDSDQALLPSPTRPALELDADMPSPDAMDREIDAD